MSVWFLFVLIAAVSHSFYGLFSKKAVSLSNLPKPLIIFFASLFTSFILFSISFFSGFPEIGDKFFEAVLITGILNIISAFLLLRAYEISELSSVFPMLLLTPVFLIGTSYFILGEKVSMFGIIGIVITLLGLFIVESGASKILDGQNKSNIIKGALLGAMVAFIFSISTNFDKMATLNSSALFAGASVNLLIALGVLPILIYRSRKISFVEIGVKKFLPLFALGIFSASTSAFHNLALGIGLVSYTILIKRTSVLFGVLWGILFLKEKNLLPKIIGSLVAISGIALILLG